MKRILSLILVAVMALGILTSCKGSSKGGSSSKEPISKQQQSSEESLSSSENTSSSTTSQSVASTASSASSASTSVAQSQSASSNSTQVSSATSTSDSQNASDISSSSSETSSSSEDAFISDSATQEEMEGSQVTESGFSYEDYRVTTSDYNRNLFYYNELLFAVADPTVIYISDTNSSEYGYFYAYGTSDQIGCHGIQGWRSKDLTNWEDMGPVYLPDYSNTWAYTNYWAPEIIYDSVGQVVNGKTYNYFMFFNAEKFNSGHDYQSNSGTDLTHYLSVVYAESPAGPFIHPDSTVKDGNGNSLSLTSPVFNFTSSNTSVPSSYRCTNTIDASPFIDDNGDKYLYFSGWGSSAASSQSIYGVRMSDWFTPLYSTTSLICKTHCITINGSETDLEGKSSGAWVNEGPFMYKDGDTYMMTFSVYPYTSTNYQVRLATSTSPLSGFTKITPSNGGTVIKTVSEWDGIVQSVGHHVFIEVGDELYIAYHTYKDRNSIAGGRALAVDKVNVMTYNGNKILYTNGPSYSYQPLPSEISGYENVASEATITGGITNNAAGLTDGIIKYHKDTDIGVSIQEVSLSANATVTLDFGTYKNVRAIMAYTSSEYLGSFNRISSAKLTYKSSSGDKVIDITNSQYDYSKFYDDNYSTALPGGAAILEFNELPIKKIELTFDSWGYDFKLNEIVVLANTDTTKGVDYATDAYVSAKYQYTNALVPVAILHKQGETIGSVRTGSTELHTTYGVDLTYDDGTENAYIKTIGPRDQYAFLKGVSTDTIYYEAELCVYESNPYLTDAYPKLGLAVKNGAACTFMYIDAANNYTNKYVGYVQSQFGGGNWDWGATEEIKAAPSISYKGEGNYVKLAIARVGGHFYFYCNGIKFFESEELRGLAAGSMAGYGFLCFNTGMKIRNYTYITDLDLINAKIAELQQATDDAAGIDATKNFGDVGDLTSGVMWDLTNDYISTDENYADREVNLTATDSADNYLYFIRENSVNLYAEATLQVQGGTLSNEAWGKIGFNLESSNGYGITFYADCRTGISTRTSTVAEMTSTNVAYATMASGDYNAWDVQTSSEKFDPTQPIKMAIYRQGTLVKMLVNDVVVFTATVDLVGTVNPAIVSFNVGLKVTDYRITSDINDSMMQELKETVDTNLITSLQFGDIDGSSELVQSGTWTTGTSTASNTAGTESAIFCKTVSGTNFYFQADVTANSVRNSDKYPKFGLYLRSNTKELFYFIDAINGGDSGSVTFGSNAYVGTVLRNCTADLAASEKDWQWNTAANVYAPVSGMVYTGGNKTTLGVYYQQGNIYLTANGRVVITQVGLSGFSSTDSVHVGLYSININLTATSAQAVATEEGLTNLKNQLGITGGDVVVDGDISDWSGVKSSYYSAYENDTVTGTKKGFKVMAFKGDYGVHVAYHAITAGVYSLTTDWWTNTNVEMALYKKDGSAAQQIYATVDKKVVGAGLFFFNYSKRTDGYYDVYVELFLPYDILGYSSSDEYVALCFAFRPGDYKENSSDTTTVAETGVGINGGTDSVAWWTGTVQAFQQSYASPGYKITADGLVGTGVTTVTDTEIA